MEKENFKKDEAAEQKYAKTSKMVEEIHETEELPDGEMEEVEGGWCFCLGGNSNNDKPTTPKQQ